MKVCIAEKPSVAREIAKVLGASARMDGYLEGNGYAVTWTFGHFCELKSPEDYTEDWKKWNLSMLPMLPERFETKLKKIKGVKKQFTVIKNLFKKAKLVINCGDAGQEGELIQRWVIKEAKYKGPVQRLWISSLTTEAIRDGFQKLQDARLYDRLYYAGSSRAIGDWLLGMNATRLYTLKYGGYKQVLSIGRVQTPTLAMMVKRHYEILRFKPEPFWELQTIYRKVAFNHSKGRFTKKEEGQALLEKVRGKDFVIVSSTKKNGKEYAPRLFDLTSLQVYCNKRFGFSADHTLKTVQKLYEQKLVTYPRVDTTYLPTDMYPKIKGILQKMSAYANFTQSVLSKPIPKSKRVFDDKKITDHHAIIPTGIQSHLSGDMQKVYDAISRTFIANFYPECKVAHTTVIGEVEGEQFKAKGKEILDPGWRVLFPKPAKKTGTTNLEAKSSSGKTTEEKILPAFKKGEKGPHEPSLLEKMTQPPKPYTEATLLRAMETAGKQVDDEELRQLMKENGIGRPSTRAGIIETLFRRKYIRRQKKNLHPTEVGIQLIDLIQNELLKSTEMTGIWERKLRQIESGEFNAKAFIEDMRKMVTELIAEVKAQTGGQRITATAMASSPSTKGTSRRRRNSVTGPASSGKRASSKAKATTGKVSKNVSINEISCPKCRQGTLLTGTTAYGCSNYKSGCSFRLPFKFMDKKISENQYRRLLAKGSTVKLKGFKQGNTKVDGKVLLNQDGTIRFEPNSIPNPKTVSISKPKPKARPKLACPKCKQGKIVKGKTAYGCSRWKENCDYRFDFSEVRKRAAGQKLTEQLVKRILYSN